MANKDYNTKDAETNDDYIDETEATKDSDEEISVPEPKNVKHPVHSNHANHVNHSKAKSFAHKKHDAKKHVSHADREESTNSSKSSKKTSKLIAIVIILIIILAILIYVAMKIEIPSAQTKINDVKIEVVTSENGAQFLANIGGKLEITKDDLALTKTFYDLQGMNLSADELLNQTIIRKVLLSNAKAYIPSDVEVNAKNDEMFAQLEAAPPEVINSTLASVNMSLGQLKNISAKRIKEDMAIRSYLEKEIITYLPKELAINASHILICYNGTYMCSQNRTKEDALTLANKIVKEAQTKDFASLAAKYSDEPGAQISNGNLGVFPKGVMVKEFEDAAFNLTVGEISKPVETMFGYHIIKLINQTEVPNSQQGMQLQTQLFQQILSKAYIN